MTERELWTLIESIKPVDRRLEAGLRAHLDDLTKPPGSLGRIEEIALCVGLIQNSVTPRVRGKRIVTFASDHGVTAEGVSAYPPEVTPQMVRNMLAGGAAINVFARHAGADVRVVDVGVNDPLDGAAGLVRRKVRSGSGNIAREPAMTREEALRALAAGVEMAREAADDGVDVLGTGEMGIGNTTPAAAVYAVLLSAKPEEVVGRGTGVDDDGLARKVKAVRTALELHEPDAADPLGVLASVGGLEIAALTGLILGGASRRLAVVVDGFISSAAALAAARLAPACADYLIFAHLSDEAGHRVLFDGSSWKPLLSLGLRLGEGTGAALAFHLIDAAIKIYNEMATFSGAGVSRRPDEGVESEAG